MNAELEEKLVKEFPKMFPHKRGFGFECGDGWYDLIHTLCVTIQNRIDNNQHLKIEQVVVAQVKEKFGGLRFYADGTDATIDGMIWFADEMSYHICEVCGAKGETNGTGWTRTTCEEHRRK